MGNKIIRLADRMKDDEDLRLEALFRSDAVNDDGFSDRVMRRIRWQIRVRRFALPLAVLLGGAIAAKPAMASRTVAFIHGTAAAFQCTSVKSRSVISS